MSVETRVPAQVVTCRAGDYYFGIDVLEVQEVLKRQEMTVVPRAPREVRGLINLRGSIVTAIGMRERLNLPEAPKQHEEMNLIVSFNGVCGSLIFDSVGEVLSLNPRDYKPRPSTLSSPLKDLIVGVYQLDSSYGGSLLLHISPEATCQISCAQEVSHA